MVIWSSLQSLHSILYQNIVKYILPNLRSLSGKSKRDDGSFVFVVQCLWLWAATKHRFWWVRFSARSGPAPTITRAIQRPCTGHCTVHCGLYCSLPDRKPRSTSDSVLKTEVSTYGSNLHVDTFIGGAFLCLYFICFGFFLSYQFQLKVSYYSVLCHF